MFWNPVWGTGNPLRVPGEAYGFYIQARTDRVHWQHLPG
jgi:hypothetical protein